MTSILLGFISASIALGSSLRYPFVGISREEFFVYFSKVLIIGGSVGMSSIVNGHDIRMFLKSRVDYLVNVIVAVICGSMVSIFCLYILGLPIFGRWVFLWLSTVYVMLVFFLQFMLSRRGKKICLCGNDVDRFTSIMLQIGMGSLNRIYEIKNLDLSKCDIGKVLKCINDGWGGYIVPARKDSLFVVDYIQNQDASIVRYLYPIFDVIENELGVVDLKAVEDVEWWNLVSHRSKAHYILFKRIFDLVLSLGIFLLSMPILLIAVIAIMLEGGGPIVYSQKRVGLWGKHFTIYKLRTMKTDSEKNGAQWAQTNDNRVTVVGRILRKTRIDELPQLWNIFVGDMSLIGPRPERPELCTVIHKEVPAFHLRLASKPGLTGWAQVNYRYGASLDDSKIKVAYDLYYIKNACLMLDFRILTRTVLSMVRGAR